MVSITSGSTANEQASAMNNRTCSGIRPLEMPGISIRHAPTRQNASMAAKTSSLIGSWVMGNGFSPRQEIAPSDFTSTPRAISTCDRTGKVAKRRSMIMRIYGRASGEETNTNRSPLSKCLRMAAVASVPNCSSWRGSISNSTISPLLSRLRL
ncbi:hypothetical protein D9M69_599180 [compost metagenome]